ncbi:MAG: protein-L-isoaspartate O-methyltransferase [Parcubacteria group bacterium]
MNSGYENLINKLVLQGYIKSSEIERAFREIDRAEFLPETQKQFAGEDRPLSIGYDQTISQPFTVAFILNLLDPQKGDNILDVGTGSGWQAALLATVVAPEGKVITVERVKELADTAKLNLEKFGLISNGSVIAVNGNALNINPEWPVFNKIVSAAEYDIVPESWKNALAVGGRIVMPVSGRLIVADKISRTEFDVKEYPGFSFVPLIAD